jgi:hypothetical protein
LYPNRTVLNSPIIPPLCGHNAESIFYITSLDHHDHSVGQMLLFFLPSDEETEAREVKRGQRSHDSGGLNLQAESLSLTLLTTTTPTQSVSTALDLVQSKRIRLSAMLPLPFCLSLISLAFHFS